MVRLFLTLGLALLCALPLDAQKQKKKAKMKPVLKTYAVLNTSMGKIEIELFDQATPKTVKNFIGLAKEGYYKGVPFHRVIDNFMIQTGDSTGTGRGGRSIYGAPFEDEFVASLRHSEPGVVSMANRGPNTNESQFFITLVPTPWLDGKHTIFGKVVRGMDVVKAIGKVKTTKPFDQPVEKVTLKSVEIIKK